MATQSNAFHRAGDALNTAPAARWWAALGDPELDRLMNLALADSPDLAMARARIVQARAGLKNARANRLPSIGSAAAYAHMSGGSGSIGGGTSGIELYTANLYATWEVDLFGGKTRAVEGARADAEAEAAAFDGVKVSLEGEVANAYVALRRLQQQLELSRRDIEIAQQMVDMSGKRERGGTASRLDVERFNTQLEQGRVALTLLPAQIAEQFDRLAVLTGREPGTLDSELSAPGVIPAPPAQVAVGDPAAMLRRRPDIRQAERKLARANAAIGQHTADLFPKVTLIGALGYSSSSPSDLFNSANLSKTALPFLQWSPFDFGRIRAQIAKAKGAHEEALASYRKTVLEALQDAETSLARYGGQRDRLAGQLRVQAVAEKVAAMQAIRQNSGTATTQDVLDAERQRILAERNALDARAELTAYYIALQKSLGLGWLM